MEFDYVKEKKILLADDEPELLCLVQSVLEGAGYRNLRTAKNVREALLFSREWKPEMAVLDVMFPDGSGFDLLREIRRFSDIPVLFLTARGEDEDKFQGLGLGADDYMVKPFLPRELIFRIGAILRRCYKEEASLVRLAACSVDLERAEILRKEGRLPLTAKEFALFSALYRNAGKIVTIDLLCEALWGENPFGYENSLMAHVRRLREKIEENPSKPQSLMTAKGLGYKLILEEKS